MSSASYAPPSCEAAVAALERVPFDARVDCGNYSQVPLGARQRHHRTPALHYVADAMAPYAMAWRIGRAGDAGAAP